MRGGVGVPIGLLSVRRYTTDSDGERRESGEHDGWCLGFFLGDHLEVLYKRGQGWSQLWSNILTHGELERALGLKACDHANTTARLSSYVSLQM